MRPHPLRTTPRRLGPALLGAAVAAACLASDPAERGPAVATVRDSAGVTLVENPAVPADATTGWTVGSAPLLDIGAVTGAEAEQLYRVRDATRLDDGRIAIVNAGSQEIRVFDATGAHVGSWGGEGDGPGEFRDPASIAPWPGDSLAVWDRRLRRLDVRPQSGEPGRSLTFPALPDLPVPVFSHRLDDGSLVVYSVLYLADGVGDGLSRLPLTAAVVDADGGLVAPLGKHVGGEVYVRMRGETMNILGLPIARNVVLGPVGNESLITQTDRFELKLWGPDGALRRVVRVAEPARLLLEGERREVVEYQVAQASEEARPRVRSMLEEVSLPDTLPAFTDVVHDASGHLWVRTFRLPQEEGPEAWIVLDDGGQVVGRIDLPEDLSVYEIGEDYILARATDDLGVEHVQMWPLDRG